MAVSPVERWGPPKAGEGGRAEWEAREPAGRSHSSPECGRWTEPESAGGVLRVSGAISHQTSASAVE